MVLHNNPSLVQRANRILVTKMGSALPDEVQGPMATIAISPIGNIVRSGTGTIYTTPADKDFYLCGCTMAWAKDATGTGTSASLSCFINGVSSSILRSPGITLTAERDSIALSLPVPIKVDRNTAITLALSGTYSSQAATIYGYTEEATQNSIS